MRLTFHYNLYLFLFIQNYLIPVECSNNSEINEEGYPGPVFGKWDKTIKTLRDDILKSYDKYSPPVDKKNKNVTEITIYLFLRFVNDFDAVSGHLESTVMIQTWWTDTRLAWDPAKYSGFDGVEGGLTFDFKEIWVPHVILWNPVNRFEIIDPSNDHLLTRVYPSSYVYFMIGGKITSHCVPNVKYFPFDMHNCYIELITYESLYYPGQIKVVSENVENRFGFNENPQWIVTVGKAEVSDFLGVGIDIIKFPITLERRSLFLLFNLFAPILLLSLINVCVFAIPCQSGERSSFAITVFLALAVYMTVVADSIPHSSHPMPLWSYFLLCKLIYSACIALSSTVIMRCANKQTPLPPWIYKIMTSGRDSFRPGLGKSVKMNDRPKLERLESFRNGIIPEDHELIQTDSEAGKQSEIMWKDVAYVLDKIFLAFFLLVAFLEMICTFIFTYTKV